MKTNRYGDSMEYMEVNEDTMSKLTQEQIDILLEKGFLVKSEDGERFLTEEVEYDGIFKNGNIRIVPYDALKEGKYHLFEVVVDYDEAIYEACSDLLPFDDAIKTTNHNRIVLIPDAE
jgi:hypothetical protein